MNRILQRIANDAKLMKTADEYNTNISSNNTSIDNSSDISINNISENNVDPNTVAEVNQLLERVEQSSNDLKDIYYSLFDNLTALYSSYPSIYQQLEMIVKLPTNEDAMNIVSFNNDLSQALAHFKDPNYLASYISNESETL